MSVDLSQFHQVFFEESHEGLDVMESALLELDVSAIEPETIDEIFRAAHSIKGGSGTFGFNDIADFTHVVETLLDQIRSGEFTMQAEHTDLFLRSVDCLRNMIQQLEAGEACDTSVSSVLKQEFQTILDGGSLAPAESADTTVVGGGEESVDNVDGGATGWKIYFKPDADMLRTGNEPLRMFRELEEMGSLSVEALVEDVPGIGSIDPEACYMAWNLELRGDVTEEQVAEVFEWVIDDVELQISPLGTDSDVAEQVSVADDDSGIAQEPEIVSSESSTAAPLVGEAKEPSDAPPAAKPQERKAKAKPEVSSIRVGIDKVDSLINMVGELVITQSMLGEIGREFSEDRLPRLMEGLEQLNQHTRELQENVMRIRMLPISFSFSRFPRLVHDISHNLGKKVELVLMGEQTELDKTVMEKIGDPLVHLVRNSLDHGIEMPEVRVANGKPETGTITLNAFHQGGNIVIQIIDDGGGLNGDRILEKAIEKNLVDPNEKLSDEQIYDLVFKPGFSTATEITDISGRGVGMDVVRRNIQELNGSIEVESTPGKGSTFTIRLPLTLAILDGQLVRVGEQVYIIPLISIVESIQGQGRSIHQVAGGGEVLRLRNEYVPIVRLWQLFNIEPVSKNVDDGLLVVVEGDNMKVAIVVDDLLAQQQVVIKSLQDNYRLVEGLSGATILGDGTVSLIVDISGLIKLAGVNRNEYKAVAGDDEAAA